MKVAGVRKLWIHFANRGLKPMVLRDFERLPDFVSSDLDITFPSAEQVPEATKAIQAFARDAGLTLITIVRRSYVYHFRMLGQGEQLVIDLHPEGEGWRGPLYLTQSELFAEATEREYWYEPALHHQFYLAIFQHILWGRFYKAKYHQLVAERLHEFEEPLRALIGRTFGPDLTDGLIDSLRRADAKSLETMVPILRWRLWKLRGLSDLRGSVRRLLEFIDAEIRITLSRSGRWIVLIGPDGVGKTTVASMLGKETRYFFRDYRYHHWIPRVTNALSRDVPPSGQMLDRQQYRVNLLSTVVSGFRILRNVIRAWLGYAFRIVPNLYRQRLVVGDRYLFNYVLDPASVRYFGPRWLARLALKLAPKPDLVIRLRAPAELVHSRKQELSLEEIAALDSRADELAAWYPNMASVSSDASIDETAAQVAARVICTLLEPTSDERRAL